MKKFQKIFIFMILISYINSTCTSKYKGIGLDDITIPTLPSDIDNEADWKSKHSPKPNKADDDDDENEFSGLLDSLEDMDGNWIDDSASAGNCKDRQLNDWEKLFSEKCCYIKGKCQIEDKESKKKISIEIKACRTVDNDTYNNIDEFTNDAKDYCDDFKVDCYSSYLILVFLSFIIILLL